MPGRSTSQVLRLRAPAAAATRLRRDLARADLHPRGLPPSAVLVVRSATVGAPGAARDVDWGRALDARLAAWADVAVRPHHGRVPPGSPAVVFSDRAELVACYVADLVRSPSRAAWWRAAPARDLGTSVATALGADVTLLPAVLDLLDGWGMAVDVVGELAPHQATTLHAHLLRTFDLPAPAAPAGPGHARTSPHPADPGPPAGPGRARAALLRTALLLRRDPASARGGSPLLPDRAVAADPPPPAPATPATAPPAGPHPPGADPRRTARPEEPPGDVDGRAPATAGDRATADGPPEAGRPGPADEGPLLPRPHGQDPAGTRRTGERDGPTAGTSDGPGARGDRPGGVEAGASARAVPGAASGDGLSPAPRRAHGASRPGAAAATPADVSHTPHRGGRDATRTARPRDDGLDPGRTDAGTDSAPTALAGAFYLVNLLPRLPSTVLRQLHPLGGWGRVEVIARAVMGVADPDPRDGSADAHDPVWRVLALLDRRAPGDPPDRVLDGEAVTAVRETVATEVGCPVDEADQVLRVPGVVHRSRTHVDVVMDLQSISVPVRLAGLDRDPGWVPVLGQVVAFHFVEGGPR